MVYVFVEKLKMVLWISALLMSGKITITLNCRSVFGQIQYAKPDLSSLPAKQAINVKFWLHDWSHFDLPKPIKQVEHISLMFSSCLSL